MNVLTKFASYHDLKLTPGIKVTKQDGISLQKVEEMQAALIELGLEDDVDIE